MRIEDLILPVSPDAPCGDDLLASDDPDFIDYYFNVEDRLPTSYFNMARGTLFDTKSVDLKGETAMHGKDQDRAKQNEKHVVADVGHFHQRPPMTPLATGVIAEAHSATLVPLCRAGIVLTFQGVLDRLR